MHLPALAQGTQRRRDIQHGTEFYHQDGAFLLQKGKQVNDIGCAVFYPKDLAAVVVASGRVKVDASNSASLRVGNFVLGTSLRFVLGTLCKELRFAPCK